MYTPWGVAQTQTTLAEGIVEASTASHGGIHVHPNRNEQVHHAWRNPTGWYEEDCEWAIVVISFPSYFDDATIGLAHETAADWFPDAYEQVSGTQLTAADSLMRREQEFRRIHAASWVVTAAWGHDGPGRSAIPNGMVGVAARRPGDRGRGEQRWYLVPAREYRDRGHSFVIDESRHAPWPPREAGTAVPTRPHERHSRPTAGAWASHTAAGSEALPRPAPGATTPAARGPSPC